MKKVMIVSFMVIMILTGNTVYAEDWIDYGQMNDIDLDYIWKIEFNDLVDGSEIEKVRLNNFLGNIDIKTSYINHIAKIDALQSYLPGVEYNLEIYLTNKKKYKLSFEGKASHPDEMLVHYIKTMQGQVALIQTPDGSNILINSGGEFDGSNVVYYLRKMGIDSLDAFIVTNSDSKYIGGLDRILKSIKINKFYHNGIDFNDENFKQLFESLKIQSADIVSYQRGDILKFGEIQFNVLLNKVYEDFKDSILLLSYDESQYLFINNLNVEIEEELLRRHSFKNIEALSFGEYGEKDEQHFNFVKALGTKYAVFQANPYREDGGVSVDVLDDLNSKYIQTYRTDILGSVISRASKNRMEWNVKPWISSLSRGEKWNSQIAIDQIDRLQDKVYIKNYGSVPIDLTNWYLQSKTGDERFTFPNEYILYPGQRIVVQSHISKNFDGENILNWTNMDIWDNDTIDIGELYDDRGNIRSSYPYKW